jgi:hypothetical protein
MNINYIYLILIIIIILFIILFIIRNKNIESFENELSNLSYYRCESKILGKILQDIFDNNNIIKSKDNWNIYIPCGYNEVEDELTKIKIKDEKANKYIFGLNGCDTIVSKNKIWESLVSCFGRKKASTLMPESFILDDLNEIELFRKSFNPSLNEIYILKKNVQRKEGLKLTRDYFEIIDGYKEYYRVAQKYITDLYLINQRKVNLRIYLLIVIKDNFIYFYVSDKGKCIYTNKKYNDDDLDFESNITSYNLDMTVYEQNPRDFEELKIFIDENESENIMNFKNGNYLFNKINLLMEEISICLSKNLYQSKNIKNTVAFQLFGADVIFDKDLHPYLLELNKGPDMTPRDEIDENMKNIVQTDMFKIVGVLPNIGTNSFHQIYKNIIN